MPKKAGGQLKHIKVFRLIPVRVARSFIPSTTSISPESQRPLDIEHLVSNDTNIA